MAWIHDQSDFPSFALCWLAANWTDWDDCGEVQCEWLDGKNELQVEMLPILAVIANATGAPVAASCVPDPYYDYRYVDAGSAHARDTRRALFPFLWHLTFPTKIAHISVDIPGCSEAEVRAAFERAQLQSETDAGGSARGTKGRL